MAIDDEQGNQDRQALSVMHELEGDQYVMTVSDMRTGALEFSWKMDKDYAITVALGMMNALGQHD